MKDTGAAETRSEGPKTTRTLVRVMVVVLGGLVAGACAPLQPPRSLPSLAVGEPSFRQTLEAYAQAPVIAGNRVALLLNGDDIFPAELAAIRSAQRTITYAQYVYEQGPIGLELAEALAERCRAGIRAHVLLDGFGTLDMPRSYADIMRTAGCEVATFRPLHPLTVFSFFGVGRGNHRNHRRILVVDGRLGFTGGAGVSPTWLGHGRETGRWRQTDARVEGPVVASLQAAFVENWLEATGNVLGGAAYFPQLHPVGNVHAQIVRSSPVEGHYTMYTSLLLAMAGARHSITITNPYFVPDSRMLQEITGAARRGVRVRIMLPGPIDNHIVRHASRGQFGELLDAGIELYEYQAGLLHAKTMTIDGLWATIGSANFDSRSFALNEELNLVVYGDRELGARLERIFTEDLAYSRKVTEKTWANRSSVDRLFEVLARPVRDQL